LLLIIVVQLRLITSGVGAGPAPISMTVHAVAFIRVMPAWPRLSRIAGQGVQLNSVSNQQPIAGRQSAPLTRRRLVRTGEPRHSRDLAQLAGLLLCLDPARPTCTLPSPLLRSEAVANGALKDDAASTRAVAALLAKELPAFAIDSAMEKARLEAAAPEVVVSRRRDGAAAFACINRRTADSVLQALVGELGFALDELDWILSASGGASSSALQSVESFRSVASRFGLLSRL
uniref:tRNA_edit domain-containing protein n=1 Tax=Macrostomum lignano TaxID=282301 RepID=A0A1I8FN76_9PLAT